MQKFTKYARWNWNDIKLQVNAKMNGFIISPTQTLTVQQQEKKELYFVKKLELKIKIIFIPTLVNTFYILERGGGGVLTDIGQVSFWNLEKYENACIYKKNSINEAC